MNNIEETLISVVVPVYNAEKYLDRCITSILGQSYKNFELLLIDDFSTDQSHAFCKKIAKNDKRVRVLLNERNKGVSFTRNRGLEEAKGKFITFIDSDDEFIVVRDSQEFLYKILDYSFISIDQVRKKLFFDGIYLEEEKGDIPRVFYIYLQKNIIIQLNFRLNVEDEKWYADYPVGQSESNNLVESYLLEDGLNNTSIFQFRNNKYLLGNIFSNLTPLGLIDWSADYAFHEKALSYLYKISKDNLDKFQLPSVSEIKEITSFLQANGIFPDTSAGYLNKEQYLARIIENTTHTNFIFQTYKKLYENLLKTTDYEKNALSRFSSLLIYCFCICYDHCSKRLCFQGRIHHWIQEQRSVR